MVPVAKETHKADTVRKTPSTEGDTVRASSGFGRRPGSHPAVGAGSAYSWYRAKVRATIRYRIHPALITDATSSTKTRVFAGTMRPGGMIA